MSDVTLTQKQAREVFDRLRSAWWSGECTADLDDAMARLNEQLEPPPYPAHERRPAEYRHTTLDADSACWFCVEPMPHRHPTPEQVSQGHHPSEPTS